TVTGNVVASGGSTIAPGNPNGTLTVAGNVTLGGGMLYKLNRTLSPNSGKLVPTCSIPGCAALTTTKNGPPFQLDGTFHLFTSGSSGITATPETVDGVNGVTYTWKDNIAASGSIKELSVTPIPPPTLGVSKSGNTLTFSWSDPLFKLQSQTNSISV